jgi:hypothetical protein
MVAPTSVMSGTVSNNPNHVVSGTISNNPTPVVPIMLEYDPTTYAVTVTPSIVAKGATICFQCSKAKVRVVFLSPFGDDGPELKDSEPRTFTVGGIYHFRCFFQVDGYPEIESPTGGVADVQPYRP